jgi:hypothetical protein
LLLPTEASAQFNIEGMIRGAIGGGCCYRGGYRHHVERSESRHAKRSKHEDDDADNSDKAKSKDKEEKDATKEQPTATASAHQQQPAGPAHDAPHSAESDAPAKPTPSSSKSYDDQPAFSPIR